jgi:hypothetical protein
MEKIWTILLICSSCCVFAEFSGVMQRLAYKLGRDVDRAIPGEYEMGMPKYQKVRVPMKLKPFDCAKCLSFWMGLLCFLIQGEGALAIFYASFCMITSIYIIRYAK